MAIWVKIFVSTDTGLVLTIMPIAAMDQLPGELLDICGMADRAAVQEAGRGQIRPVSRAAKSGCF